MELNISAVLRQLRQYLNNPKFEPSTYQMTIFEWIVNGIGNGIIAAVAGSGKTFTLELIAQLLPKGEAGLFLAFNRHIARELQDRFAKSNVGMIAQTIHVTGKQALQSFFAGRVIVDEYILPNILKYDSYFKSRNVDYTIIKLLEMGCYNLVDFSDNEALFKIIQKYDIPQMVVSLKEMNRLSHDEIMRRMRPYFDATRRLLEIAEQQARNAHKVDFTGMIYWPIKWNVPFTQYKWVFVDECQDLSPLQLKIVLRCIGGRALAVGDSRQSIMGFAGADTDSFESVQRALNAKRLPLSVCYRCPDSHLQLARKIVPEIETAPGAQQGTITRVVGDEQIDVIVDNQIELVMSRTNAPLMRVCLKLIARGVRARVRGRDVSKTLTALVKNVGKTIKDMGEEFSTAVENHIKEQIHELSKRDGNDNKIEILNDQRECVLACYDFYRVTTTTPTIDGLVASIDAIFADDIDANAKKIDVWCSSVHRSKGLQARRVAILNFLGMPMRRKRQSLEQFTQELNLLYVALTRATEGVWLCGYPDKKSTDIEIGNLEMIPVDEAGNLFQKAKADLARQSDEITLTKAVEYATIETPNAAQSIMGFAKAAPGTDTLKPEDIDPRLIALGITSETSQPEATIKTAADSPVQTDSPNRVVTTHEEDTTVFLSGSDKKTPLWNQYQELLKKVPAGNVLLVQLGDFYEAFGADAICISNRLGLTTVVHRYGAKDETKMAGFPVHALDTYAAKLIEQGVRFSLAKQVGTEHVNGLMARELVDYVPPIKPEPEPAPAKAKSTHKTQGQHKRQTTRTNGKYSESDTCESCGKHTFELFHSDEFGGAVCDKCARKWDKGTADTTKNVAPTPSQPDSTDEMFSDFLDATDELFGSFLDASDEPQTSNGKVGPSPEPSPTHTNTQPDTPRLVDPSSYAPAKQFHNAEAKGLYADPERQAVWDAVVKRAKTLHASQRFTYLSDAQERIFSERLDWAAPYLSLVRILKSENK